MSNKFNVSVILPIKSALAKDFDEYFKKAIDSLKNQKVSVDELVIVHTQEETLVKLLEVYDFGELSVTKLVWDKSPNFAEQVNYGISQSRNSWVSLFEFDDEYSNIWFKNVLEFTQMFRCSYL